MTQAIVCGGRDYIPTRSVLNRFRQALARHGITTIHHGDARGVDRYVGKVCENWGLRVERHPANWDLHGRRAGMIRNAEMLEKLSVAVVFAFEGGVGTANMERRAAEAGVLLERIR
jgi:hypothetical protein